MTGRVKNHIISFRRKAIQKILYIAIGVLASLACTVAGTAQATTVVTVSGNEQSTANGNWDSGTLSLTIAGCTKQIHFGQGSTIGSIAADFAYQFSNDPSSPVFGNANALGQVIFTSRTASPALPNLLQNGGFETGDFSAWTLTMNGSTLDVNDAWVSPYIGVEAADTPNSSQPNGSENGFYVHGGAYAAQLGSSNPAVLSQTIVDSPGQLYNLTFWLNGDSYGMATYGATNGLNAAVGASALNLPNDSAYWTQYSVQFVGTGSDTIAISSQDGGGVYVSLDDIAVSVGSAFAAPQSSVTYDSADFASASFSLTPQNVPVFGTAAGLRGSEQNAGSGWDTGHVTVSVAGTSETVSYGQFDTPASLAQAVTTAFTLDPASQIVGSYNSLGQMIFSSRGAALASPNLIVNGGFESADFTGWSVAVAGSSYTGTDPTIGPYVGVAAADTANDSQPSSSHGLYVWAGSYAAQLGSSQGATLSQSVTDKPGELYTVSFLLNDNDPNINATHLLSASMGGASMQLKNTGSYWRRYTFQFIGNGSDTLKLSTQSSDGVYLSIDDVQVTAANALPHPSVSVVSDNTNSGTSSFGVSAITWSTPDPIVAGAALGSVQLHAAFPDPGSFVYTPANNAVLPIGRTELKTVFTPSGQDSYATSVAAVTQSVVPPVQITINPSTDTISGGQTVQFNAAVTNTSNTGVTWSISPVIGSIEQTGLYHAPSNTADQEAVTVTATSMADPTRSSSANVTVVHPQCITCGFSGHEAVVISHSMVANSDQIDFPLEVAGTFPFLANVTNGGSIFNPNGYDVVFTADAAGAIPLDFEIDTYDATTGRAAFWVRIPLLSHFSDTTIFMWYGNSNIASSLENRLGVWRNNYLSVYHLGNGATINYSDSGPAGYTLHGGAPPVGGQVGGAAHFNGDPSGALRHDSVPAYPVGQSPVTLEAWAFATPNDSGEIVGYGENTFDGSRAGLGSDGSVYMIEFENMAVSGPGPHDGNWHYLVGEYSGNSLTTDDSKIYVDGVNVSTDFTTGSPSPTSTQLSIGAPPTVSGCCAWTGGIDEVRISAGMRSADWIATEYANESSASYVRVGNTPSISTISPATASVGALIDVAGQNFGLNQGSSTITVNGESLTPVNWSDQHITFLVPAGALSGPATVTVGGATSNSLNLAIVPSAVITWPSPNPVSYGTPLSSNQLNATSSVPGTFSYSPGTGSVLPIGTNVLTVSFTPNDTGTYQVSTASVNLVVERLAQVTVAPSVLTVAAGHSQQFTASVTNTMNQFVTWSIDPAGYGSIDQSGLYTAPTSGAAQTVTVKATSQEQSTQSGTATMSVSGAGGVSTSGALWSDNSPATPGTPVNLTMEIQSGWNLDPGNDTAPPSTNHYPTGTVTFYEGSNVLGTSSVQSNLVNQPLYEVNFLYQSEYVYPTNDGFAYGWVDGQSYEYPPDWVAAPDGSNNAIEYTAQTNVSLQQAPNVLWNLAQDGTYVSSIWMKSPYPGACSGMQLGTMGMDYPDGAMTSVSIGNTWQRYSGGPGGFWSGDNVVFTLSIPSNCTVDLWGAQLEENTAMSSFQYTTYDGLYPFALSSAVFQANNLSAGSHSIRAVYSGDDYNAGSTAFFTQYVGLVNTSSTFDFGTLTFQLNQTSVTANWDKNSTTTTLATSLASAMQQQSGLPVTVTASANQIILTPPPGTVPSYTFSVAPSAWDYNDFSAPSFYGGSGSQNLPTGDSSTGSTIKTIYSYTVPSDGYFPNGDLRSYKDKVMGLWTFGYDNLDRLVTAAGTSPAASDGAPPTQYLCWAYDEWGNRLQQANSDIPFTSDSGTCTTTGTLYGNVVTSYDVYNQITQTNASGTTILSTKQAPMYDDGGNVIDDGANQYAYDAEGRVCATWNLGTGSMTGYLYDAEGSRVAKGSIHLVSVQIPYSYNYKQVMSCDVMHNGFTQEAGYVVGPSGEQLTEIDQSGNWKHTNVWSAGKLIATYDAKGLHFHIDDPLGTRRVQTNAAGVVEATYQSLPFGDGFQESSAGPNVSDPTQNHFTGKERDTETGNDYFLARYYNSATGRFLSPDWSAKEEPVPYARMDNPQTLNLYVYVRNNPLSMDDPDGHWPDCDWCSQVGSSISSVVGNPRVELAGKAALNVAVAGVKLTEAAAGAAAAPETGGLTLAVTVYQGISAAGNLAAAASQVSGAISGDVKSGQAGADVASAATTISGVATLTATGGNVEKASQAADIENGVTTGLSGKTLFDGSKAQVTVKVLDAAQSTHAAAKSGADVIVPDPEKHQ